jgi:uncharacterized membrane protein YqjE
MMSATKTDIVTAQDGHVRSEIQSRSETESLPNLLSRLSDDVLELLNSQVALLKVEIKEEANNFARGAAMISVGAVIAAIGFALLNIAIALGVSMLFVQANFSPPASYALGFVVTGVFYLVVGFVTVLIVKNRLKRQSLVPRRTVQELRKDKEWLTKEL